jgi:predicted phosphate transport protein (TIGR00153 family)
MAATDLHILLHDYTNVAQKVGRITEIEHSGDSITHAIMEELHRTFVTPLDREDISALAQGLDDVLDFIEDAANSLYMYSITKPTKRSQQFSVILVDVTDELMKAMPRLRKRSDMKHILKHCVEVNRLENEADSVLRFALVEAFANMPIDEVIKWREIYEHLENAVDKSEDVANVLEGVVLKHG